MKHFFLLPLFALLGTSAFSQCVVDAGANQHVCFPENLGANVANLSATISAGVAPYQIEWKTTYQTGSTTQDASDFLDDVHSLNPTLVSFVSDSLVFYIEISDDNGNNCSDSVIIGFSPSIMTLDDCVQYIHREDSVALFVPGIGAIPNLQYTWSPNYNISDIHAENPLVWPDSTMSYTVSGIDLYGCIYNSAGCFVTVYQIGVDENQKEKFSIFPNPAQDVLQVKIDNIKNVTYAIIDITGKIVQSNTLNGESIDISRLATGVYSLQLSNKETVLGGRKFIKQ